MNGDNGVYVAGDHSDHSTSNESPKAKVPRVETRFSEHVDTTPPFRSGAPPMCRLSYNRPPLRGPRGIPVNGAPSSWHSYAPASRTASKPDAISESSSTAFRFATKFRPPFSLCRCPKPSTFQRHA
ncbi:unnamed protein product [Dibothriocephalus latus]|uniref:Uncharacterized protein n=1 Tax=Dibothriocephalus latus TaxID=60516 RepID=A0A3P7L359_DIBLA|nr:unnamed protein product [Dibothriocephalus latus]